MAIVIIDLLNDDEEESQITEIIEEPKLIKNIPEPQLQIVEADEIKSPSYHEIFSI